MTDMLYAHHLSASEVIDGQYAKLYQHNRRDSHFAGAIQVGDKIHALRDHLGIVPLYYRYTTNGGVRFATDLDSLIATTDRLIPNGIDVFSKFATVRFAQLFEEIHIVPPASVIEIDPKSQQTRLIYRYEFTPHNISWLSRWEDLVNEFKRLMVQALEKTIQNDTVGLYLSGGIDSAMIAILLRDMGVNVRGYTSGPWGETGSDISYARRNAEIAGIQRHELDYLDTSNYATMMDNALELYQSPKGNPTILGVASLWQNTSINTEKQIFYGQNCDNMMGSMTAQHLTLLLQPLPSVLRRRIHPALSHSNILNNFANLAKNYANDYHALHLLQPNSDMNQMQKLIMASMSIIGISSSEVFSQPAITHNINISNPYHNIDLVEFVMGLPLRFRFSYAKQKQIPIPITEKHLIRKLAARYLPADMVKRKKAFTVSFERDEATRRLYQDLPLEIHGIKLSNENERFSGAMLDRWLGKVGHQAKL